MFIQKQGETKQELQYTDNRNSSKELNRVNEYNVLLQNEQVIPFFITEVQLLSLVIYSTQ